MRFLIGWLAAAGLAVHGPSLAFAQDGVAEASDRDLSTLASYEVWDDMVAHLSRGDLSGVRPHAEILRERAQSPSQRSVALTFLGAADLGEGRRDEAIRRWKEANRIADLSDLLRYQYSIALTARDHVLAGQVFDDMLVMAPAAARRLDQQSLFAVVSQQRGKRDEAVLDRIVRMAELEIGTRLGWLPMAAAARILALDPTQHERAWTQLDRVTHRELVEDMLTDRRYEALWPRIEAKYADGLQPLLDAELARSGAAVESGDLGALTGHLQELMEAGEIDRALELSEGRGPTLEDIAAIEGPDQAWFVNARALLLDHVGRKEEADALYATLVTTHREDDRGIGLVNFAINWIEQMIGNGQFERAAEHLDMVQSVADEGDATPYAYQLIARQRYCVLSRTGAPADAVAAALAAMEEKVADAALATAEGFVCAGDRDKAAAILVTMLDDDATRAQAIRALQPFSNGRERTDPSLWKIDWAELRADPALEAAYRAAARDLPPAFRLKGSASSAQ